MALSVEDNGAGIKTTDSPVSGMGLRSMRYRASILNGSIEISAMAGGGTRLCCRAPLTAPADSDSIYAS